MRELTSHKVNECNEAITVEVLDQPGRGGACHVYRMTWPDKRLAEVHDNTTISFQNGPIKEVGTNGITEESLLAILIDRLEHFQAGEYACDENAAALKRLKQASCNLHDRTRRRVEQGVEGTHAGT